MSWAKEERTGKIAPSGNEGNGGGEGVEERERGGALYIIYNKVMISGMIRIEAMRTRGNDGGEGEEERERRGGAIYYI